MMVGTIIIINIPFIIFNITLGGDNLIKIDPILGLCWLKQEQNISKFIVGSAMGQVSLGDSNRRLYAHGTTQPVCCFPTFHELTSVHVNYDDTKLLLSGYAQHVELIDIATGQSVTTLKNVHDEHVNISRFANMSPHLFATSSLDGNAKLWDLRCLFAPIHKITSPSTCTGLLMLIFSPDDNYLLLSGIDNEVVQHHVFDGRKFIDMKIGKRHSDTNFTRSYYSASGQFVLSGSTGSDNLSILCASSGQLVSQHTLFPGRRSKDAYIQSLRGNPTCDFSACVLVHYRDSLGSDLVLLNDLNKPIEVENRKQTNELISVKTRGANCTHVSADEASERYIVQQFLTSAELSRDINKFTNTSADLILVLSSSSSIYWKTTASLLQAMIPKLCNVLGVCDDLQINDAKTWLKSTSSQCLFDQNDGDVGYLYSSDFQNMQYRSLDRFAEIMISSGCNVTYIPSIITFITDNARFANTNHEDILRLCKNICSGGDSDNYVLFLVDLFLVSYLFDAAEPLGSDLILKIESQLMPINVCFVLNAVMDRKINAERLHVMLLRYVIIHFEVIKICVSTEEIEKYMCLENIIAIKHRLCIDVNMKKSDHVEKEIIAVENGGISSMHDIRGNLYMHDVQPISDTVQRYQLKAPRRSLQDNPGLGFVRHGEMDIDVYTHGITNDNDDNDNTDSSGEDEGVLRRVDGVNDMEDLVDSNEVDDYVDDNPKDTMMPLLGDHRAVRLSDDSLLFVHSSLYGLCTFSFVDSAFSMLLRHDSDKLSPEGLSHFDVAMFTAKRRKFLLIFGGNVRKPQEFMYAMDIAQLKYIKVNLTHSYTNFNSYNLPRLGGLSVVQVPSSASTYETYIVYGGYDPDSRRTVSTVYVVRVHINTEISDEIEASWHMPRVQETNPSDMEMSSTWGHTSVMCVSGSTSRMVVFGGVTARGFTNEVRILRCDELNSSIAVSTSSVFWEQTNYSLLEGPRPGPRFKHAMTIVESTNQIVMFGGEYEGSTLDTSRRLMDLWILTIHDGTAGVDISWQEIELSNPVGSDEKFLSEFGYTITQGCKSIEEDHILYVFGCNSHHYLKVDASTGSATPMVPSFISHTVETCFDLNQHINSLRSGDHLYRFYTDDVSNEFLDVLLIIRGYYRSVNSVIFSARSKVFERILARSKETSDEELDSTLKSFDISEFVHPDQPVKVITFPNIEEPKTLDAIVKFVYADSLVVEDIEELLAIMYVAHEFHIERLMQLCENALCRCATKENCLNLLCCAEELCMESLYTVCVGLIYYNKDYLHENGLFDNEAIPRSSPIIRSITEMLEKEALFIEKLRINDGKVIDCYNLEVAIGKEREKLTLKSISSNSNEEDVGTGG